ncbi:hypothetical protein GOV06_04125 [Candidatus Woesearchaeota archaeon]|nr:hypothetical protein [Candidatus Woesearchaeota archaeon]
MEINKGKTNEELVERYLARLKAREQEPQIIEPEIVHPQNNGLVYATADGQIFLFKEEQDDMLIADTGVNVADMCVHNRELLDAGQRIYNTLEKTHLRGQPYTPVQTLCSHKGELYLSMWEKIYVKTPDGTREVTKRLGGVNALCSHNGELYDAGNYGNMYVTLNSIDNKFVEGITLDLCSDGSTLYAARSDRIYKPLEKEVVLEEPIDARFSKICFHNGELYYVINYNKGDGRDHYAINKCPSREEIVSKNIKISAMCSIPPSLVKRISGK